jgi:hypothetical protein
MFLTAQRVLSPDGKSGLNSFLYAHGDIPWKVPPEPIAGSIGELTHIFLTVPQGGNKILSYLDVVTPDGTSYGQIRDKIFPWLNTQAQERKPLPWIILMRNMRFGLHTVQTLTWKSEVDELLLACRKVIAQSVTEHPASQRSYPRCPARGL